MDRQGEKLLKIAQWVCFAVFLTPLILGPFGISLSNYPKAVYFRTLVELVFIIYLFLICFKKFPLPRFSWLSLSVLFSLVVLFISSLFGFNFNRSFWGDLNRAEGLIFYLHLYVFFVVLSSIFRNKTDWVVILRITCLTGLISSLAGFLQRIGVITLYGLDLPSRISGTWTNPDFFGPYIVLNIFLVIALLFLEDKKSWQLLWAFVCAFDIIALILSGTRSAWVGFGIGFILILLYYYLFSERGKEKRKYFLLIVLFFSILLLVFSMFGSSSDSENAVFNRFSSLFNINSILDSSRTTVWKLAYNSWLEKPFLGWGLESFGYLYDKNYKSDFLRSIPENIYFDRAHNKFLDQATSTGLLGLFSYFLTLVVLFIYLARGKERDPQGQSSMFSRPIFRVIIGSLIVANFIQGLFIFDNIGTCLIITVISALIDANFTLKLDPRIEIKAPRILKLVLFILLTYLALYFFYEANFKSFLASRHFVVGAESDLQKKFTEAFTEYEKGTTMNTVYDRDLRMELTSRGIVVLENMSLPKNTEGEIVAVLSRVEPYLEESLGKPDRRTMENFEIVARIEERKYLKDQNPESLQKMENICMRIQEFQGQAIQSYRMLGRVRFYQARFAEGEELFKKVFIMTGDDSYGAQEAFYKNLGVSYYRVNKIEKAGENFKKSFDIAMAMAKFTSKTMNDTEAGRVLSYAESVAQFFLKVLNDKETFNYIANKTIKYFPNYQKRLRYDFEMMAN